MIRIYCFRDTGKEDRNRILELAWEDYTRETAGEAMACPELLKTGKGKPYFAGDTGVCISITDSREYRLIALADREIGIDLQIMSSRKNPCSEEEERESVLKLARRFYHPGEKAFVEEEDQVCRFYRVWTAKEAFVKYRGTGIDGSFGRFNVLDLPSCRFDYLAFREGYSLCLCQESKGAEEGEVIHLPFAGALNKIAGGTGTESIQKGE